MKVKDLKKFKLNKLSEDILNEQEMNILRGGGAGNICGCACAAVYSGGSVTAVNMVANSQTGSVSYGGICTEWISYGASYYFDSGRLYVSAPWMHHCEDGCEKPPHP